MRRLDLAAERIATHDRLARHAGELRVPGPLDALEPARGALEAEDVRRQLPVRIEPERLGEEAEPGLAQRLDPVGNRRRQLPPQPDEGAGARQRRVHLRLGDADQRRDARGDANRVADAARLDEERLGRGRGCQRSALAVDDRTALGAKDHGAGVLALGDLGQVPVLDDHQPRQAAREAAEHDRQDRREQEDPRPDGGVLHRAPGAASAAARLRSAARPVPALTYSRASRT